MQSVLLIFLVMLVMVIMYFVYSENSKSAVISQKISNLKMDCPSCPDVTCPSTICPENRSCPKCPTCPSQTCPTCPKVSCPTCPNTDYPSVDDIISGIFPGRDPSIRFGGNYFPVDSITESCPTPGMPYNNTPPVGSNLSDVSSSADSTLPGNVSSAMPPARPAMPNATPAMPNARPPAMPNARPSTRPAMPSTPATPATPATPGMPSAMPPANPQP
jgi:hypothetical protein